MTKPTKPDRASADQLLASADTPVQQLATKAGVSVEEAEAVLAITEDERAMAELNFRSAEHALALDPVVLRQLEGQQRHGAMAQCGQLDKIAPADEIERMIALQMVAMHGLTLRATRGAHDCKRMDQYRDYANVANKSSRTFAALAETLARHRGKTSEQKVTVEHVHVHAGGQAIVGAVDGVGVAGVGAKKGLLPHG